MQTAARIVVDAERARMWATDQWDSNRRCKKRVAWGVGSVDQINHITTSAYTVVGAVLCWCHPTYRREGWQNLKSRDSGRSRQVHATVQWLCGIGPIDQGEFYGISCKQGMVLSDVFLCRERTRLLCGPLLERLV